MAESVEIRFDGVRFGAWTDVQVRESVDDICASVRLTSVVAPGSGSNLGITANSVVEVLVDERLVATTRVDALRRSVGATSHQVGLEARSLGRELVDCQYSLRLSGLHLGEVAKRLCALFKVPLVVPDKTALVPEFAMQCEQPANALLNAARAANMLLFPTPDGGVTLMEPTADAAVATLEYGRDIVSYEIVDEHRLRFSDYVVKTFDYANDRALKGGAKDEGIGFFRPMHIVADRHGHDLAGCDNRAELERNRRRARANRLELTLKGWGHANDVWRINTQVRVVIGPEDVDEVLLVGERTLSFNAKGGRETKLQLMPRTAFLGQPAARRKRSSGVSSAGKRQGGAR